jgi:succinate dehydrogenase hydrophobic anchor subunit
MHRILRQNGLSIVLVLLMFFFLAGQIVAGMLDYNEEQRNHGQPEVNLVSYLATPHFVEATTENWESEFLQMAAFVFLTACLYQKGSAESKKLDEEEPVDRDPRKSRKKKDAPWPVRKGGLVLSVYEHSLSLAFLLLFILSFTLHAISGAREYSEDQRQHGNPVEISTVEYISTSRFWFESFQNWQSEFLAVGAMVLLSIFLRQRGSPESKPVDSPHSETGKG